MASPVTSSTAPVVASLVSATPLMQPAGASSLADFQKDFAARVRAGATSSPDAYQGRAGLYHRLIFANVCSFINSCFPVCRALMSQAVWRQLCEAFFREHSCQSPLFHHIPLEFISWLQQPNRFRHRKEPVYLTHLAHYEFCELQVQTAPDIIHYGPTLNCLRLITPIQLGSYPYPVHRIGVQNRAPPLVTTRLLLWRKPDDSVGFAEISPKIYQLLELINAPSCDLAELFNAWAQCYEDSPSAEQFIAIVRNLAQLGVVEVCQ